MTVAPVLIVGGGAAGLSAAAALGRHGVDALVLEQDAQVGGSWARRYDRLHLHTIRECSGLAHYPIPKRYPRYLSRDDVVAYLKEYAQHFNLNIVQRTRVRRIAASGPGEWHIETDRDSWRSRVVVIATGQYSRPVIPAWPNRDEYGGALTHSAGYSNAGPFRGQRVLVVGAGNSGAEIATDLAEGGASHVAISVRTMPIIVPRDPFGMPVQRTSLLLSALPASVANRIAATTARLTVGNLAPYGLPAPPFNAYTTKRIPLLDVGFVRAVKTGRLRVRPAVAGLTRAGAAFVDGSEDAFDAIVAATGFTCGLESLFDGLPVLDAAGEPLGRSGEPTVFPGLYFMGFTHSLRGHLFEANRDSRNLARHVTQYLAT